MNNDRSLSRLKAVLMLIFFFRGGGRWGAQKRCTMGDVQSANGDYDKSLIDQAFSFKMDGYWPPSCFAFLLTSTSFWSIRTQK